MAGGLTRKRIRSLTPKKRKRVRVTYEQKAKKIRLFKSLSFSATKKFNKAQKKTLDKEWTIFKHFGPRWLHKKKDKSTLDILKSHGYTTTDKGVILDVPRTATGKPIKGARVRVNKSGVVVESVGDRRDYIIGLTPAERREFAKDPEAFVMSKLKGSKSKRLKNINLKKHYIRLQWGAYSGRVDYKLSVLKDYFTNAETGKINKKKLGNLTGIRITIFLEDK